MARKYPPDIDDAMSAALARGEQPSAIYDQLTRGTLDGLSRPVDMPRRSFRYRVQRIRERMVAEREPKRPPGSLAAELAERERELQERQEPEPETGRENRTAARGLGRRIERRRALARKLTEHGIAMPDKVPPEARQRARELLRRDRTG